MKVYGIHGNAQDKRIFQNIVFEDFDLLELAGHGDAQKIPFYSIKSYADNLEEKILGDCILAGHSLGGHIAIELASRLSNVKGLLLSGTPPLCAATVANAFNPIPCLGVLYEEAPDPDLVKAFCTLQNTAANFIPTLLDMFNLQDPHARTSLLESIGAGIEDEINLIKNLHIPIYIAFGDKEALVNIDYVKSLNLRPIRSIDGGHNFMLDNPEGYQQLLIDLISEIQQ